MVTKKDSVFEKGCSSSGIFLLCIDYCAVAVGYPMAPMFYLFFHHRMSMLDLRHGSREGQSEPRITAWSFPSDVSFL